jgi:hypothetical protein
MHPHLKFDLMGRQIEALHAIGVRAPIYVFLFLDIVLVADFNNGF